MYRLLRPLFFSIPAELSHNLTVRILALIGRYTLFQKVIRFIYKRKYPSLERELFGLRFPNPVGLSAGMDKNGEICNEMSDLGFGFVEIGSVTPLPQAGSHYPRMVRLRKDKAIFGRRGSNNAGVMRVIENLKRARPEVIIAANISKNSTSEGDKAIQDYTYSFSMLHDFVDMFVITLDDFTHLSEIIDELLDKRLALDAYKPILIKIYPDLGQAQIDEILHLSMLFGIDGVVAGGSSSRLEGLKTSERKLAILGDGEISGAPVFERDLNLVRYISEKTKGRLPIIASGGISSGEDAAKMLEAGASLVELYTGLIYNGPSLVRKINNHLSNITKC